MANSGRVTSKSDRASRRPGRALEVLVARIEQALANNKSASISSPCRLRDRITGRLREFDVVIQFHENHHEICVAIECRDRSRPVTVEQVESFSTKCQHTGVHRGIIVSPRGFHDTAKTKADALGIACFGLEEIENVEWLVPKHFELRSARVLRSHFTFEPAVPVEGGPETYVVVDAGGNELRPDDMDAAAAKAIDTKVRAANPGIGAHRVLMRFPIGDLRLLNRASGSIVALKAITAEIEYEERLQLFPFKHLRYADAAGGSSLIAEVAVAKVDLPQHEVEFLIAYNPQKGGGMITSSTPKPANK